ncbi:hypothetical protein MPSEU_000172300 [Mayamaea pseudoterrestris]|nr:hypothetical protein MPSEU_000172300 [Mayamaea pseudoterrestris]
MSEPLLLVEQHCSYAPSTGNAKTVPLLLSPELAIYCVSFLTVEPVNASEVIAAACSSTDGRHDLQECLTEDESTWWISNAGSMPRGQGCEWVELQLGPVTRRISSVSVKIPPLPLGPLSVETFHLQIPDADSSLDKPAWRALPTQHVVTNRTGWQHFALPEPVDASRIRIVCLRNQMAGFTRDLSPELVALYESVGFYSVRFD